MFYRNWVKNNDLISFNVVVKESDLYIQAQKDLTYEALQSLCQYRTILEKYIQQNPIFKNSLESINVEPNVPLIIKKMVDAGKKMNVGPMAAVAGAIAEFIGQDLLKYSDEIIIENGGDIFLKTKKHRYIGIYAGNSYFTHKISLKILPNKTPLGICTSSGTLGRSLSFGKADAVIVISQSAIFADVAATSIGNLIKEEKDLSSGIKFAKKIKEIKGVLIIKNDKMSIWGDIEIC